jgi:hypothetical protein
MASSAPLFHPLTSYTDAAGSSLHQLGEQLRRLLQVLEPIAGALWELADSGYEANWYCWVESHATEHAVELDRQLMQRLLTLPGDLWLDVCGDGEDEDPNPDAR